MNDKNEAFVENVNKPTSSVFCEHELTEKENYADRILSLSRFDTVIAMLYWNMEMNASEVSRALRIPQVIVLIRITHIRKKVFRYIDTSRRLSSEEERIVVKQEIDAIIPTSSEDPWLAQRVINISHQEAKKKEISDKRQKISIIVLLFIITIVYCYFHCLKNL